MKINVLCIYRFSNANSKTTHINNPNFPKDCGSGSLETIYKSNEQNKTLSETKNFKVLFENDDLIPSAQEINEQFVQLPVIFIGNRKRTGNKNDGFYYPDFSGRFHTVNLC